MVILKYPADIQKLIDIFDPTVKPFRPNNLTRFHLKRWTHSTSSNSGLGNKTSNPTTMHPHRGFLLPIFKALCKSTVLFSCRLSSAGRAPVSKTGSGRFDASRRCHAAGGA